MTRVVAVMPGWSGSTGKAACTTLTMPGPALALGGVAEFQRRIEPRDHVQAATTVAHLGLGQHGVVFQPVPDNLLVQLLRIGRHVVKQCARSVVVEVDVEEDAAERGDLVDRYLDVRDLALLARVEQRLTPVETIRLDGYFPRCYDVHSGNNVLGYQSAAGHWCPFFAPTSSPPQRTPPQSFHMFLPAALAAVPLLTGPDSAAARTG